MAHNHWVLLCVSAVVALCMMSGCEACGDDCPGDCETQYKCVDRSELCDQLKHHCENFFFRKCIRCACPRSCGVCGSSREREETNTTTTSTTSTTTTSTMQPTTNATTTTSSPPPPSTAPPSTPAPSTSEPSTDPPSPSPAPSTVPPSTVEPSTADPSTPEPEPSSTVEEISDAVFNNPAEMKCKSCEAKRKKLAEIYDKYYPK